jgi:hypothetical protein
VLRGRSGSVAALLASLSLFGLTDGGAAQEGVVAPDGPVIERAIPGPVRPPVFFERAVDRATRSPDGSPGESYWHNWSVYDVEAALDPAEARVEGNVSIEYRNRSPYGLQVLVLHLHQNLHAEGVVRNEPQEVTGGMVLSNVSVDGVVVDEGDIRRGPGYQVEGTIMTIRPPEPVEAGDTVTIGVTWENVLPQNGAGRMGWSEKEMFFVAYWYPRMAVFDDLRGWDAEPYRGGAEFYDGFGDYRVSLTVPAGWTLMATGELLNPEEVYSARTLQRLEEAAGSDERVVVATTDELAQGGVTARDSGTLTYSFQADSVRDFAWTTSNVQRWDAASAVVPDRDGDGVEDRSLIHSFWREERAPLWDEQWRYAKQSLEFHARYTGLTYPWPHMTSVEGADIIGGGMEFPMMTVMGPYVERRPQDLFNVTSHELAHMWIPMIVGSNEKRYAWMDEGLTTFLENQSRMELWPGVDHHRLEARGYLQAANAQVEQPLMRHGDWYEPGPGYGVASYAKPAALQVALREIVMGEEAWREAYRTFIEEWKWKLPTPWDLFHTFERFHGEDLDWFWTSFYLRAWPMDHAVTGLETRPDGTRVVRIEDRGVAPFPATVRIRTSDGGTLVRDVPVEHWLRGNTAAELEIPSSAGTISRVELNPTGYAPDADRSNDFWPRG